MQSYQYDNIYSLNIPSCPDVVRLLFVIGELVISAFRDGKLAGGRLAEGTLPNICIPCLRGTWFFCADGSADSPFWEEEDK